jgi:hypothetical protein
MRTVGKLLRELRLASNTVLHELTDVLEEPPAKTPASAPKSETPAIKPTENK